jgi:Mg2+ and Co2+ transporter CorA
MRVFHTSGEQFTELPGLPPMVPAGGFLWLGLARSEFEAQIGELQAALQRWTGGQLVDLHISDLLNKQLPSHYDYTSWYDMLVFRRLVAGVPAAGDGFEALATIETAPVGFAVFDRVLITVHSEECVVRDFFAQRLASLTGSGEARAATRLPTSPADLMLRMVNYMVDSYLDLRRLLTKQLAALQAQLFDPRGRFADWQVLLESRNALHLLEDTCEDQRSAVQEWIDALDEWPEEHDADKRRERELLRVRARDVLEHIERVLSHVRRLESSAESSVQMHFSALGHRTNDIMRTLTVLTAIFLPLNLITGFFGMNFDSLPLTHSSTGLWTAFGLMVVVALVLVWVFRRKRYLSSSGR